MENQDINLEEFYAFPRIGNDNKVERIENILETDLDFPVKLAPRELGILAAFLKDLVERGSVSDGG